MAGHASLFEREVPSDSVGGVFARVAVERGIDRIDDDGGLTYRVGSPVEAGQRVEVPLGRAGKLVGGIVVRVGGAELLGGVAVSRVRPIARADAARLTPDLLRLARWMAEYYVAPLGMVLAGMMPAAVKHGTGVREVECFAPAPSPPAPAPRLRPAGARAWEIIRRLPPDRFPMPARELAGVAGLRTTATLERLEAAGLLVRSVLVQARGAEPAGLPSVEGGREGEVVPTEDQRRVIEGVGGALGRFGVHLLRGVTGSGKTEVYLRLIARVLAGGGSAIVLVPEISLTPQTAGRFTRRLGEANVAVLHSGLTASRRHREWSRVASGEARVVVGARSAVFAPVRGLGLIVVDEEHDGSYKQDRLPRYHARDVSVIRGSLAGCPVLLGSATPSLESWANARGPSPKYRLWELGSRVGGAQLPEIRIVDMREERRARRDGEGDDRRLHLLGPTLEHAIDRTLRAGGQVLILHNRRGFASYVWCRNAACGFVVSCDQCDANLVVHRGGKLPAGGVVRCHHCESEQRVPRVCPACGGPVAMWGGGTQRAEDELASKFAALGLEEGRTMLRLDSDTMRSARDYATALSRFARGEVRLLLGTQMIAKGLDYPGVRLVGVIDADLSLHIPDFRASERTFQLVSQVAGRAGRGDAPGLVVLQTNNPEAAPIVLAASHDYQGFAASELAVRARAGLPPCGRMARVVCRDKDGAVARRSAAAIADVLAAMPGLRVRGPTACVVSRVAGQYRVAVEAVGPAAGVVQRALASARQAGLLRSDASTAIDVDPVALL